MLSDALAGVESAAATPAVAESFKAARRLRRIRSSGFELDIGVPFGGNVGAPRSFDCRAVVRAVVAGRIPAPHRTSRHGVRTGFHACIQFMRAFGPVAGPLHTIERRRPATRGFIRFHPKSHFASGRGPRCACRLASGLQVVQSRAAYRYVTLNCKARPRCPAMPARFCARCRGRGAFRLAHLPDANLSLVP